MRKKIKSLIYLIFLSLCSLFLYSWARYKANPPAIVHYLLAQIGSSVGISLTVPENPFNTWAKQLQEKEENLQQREAMLIELLNKTEKEAKILLSLILVLLIVLFFLLFLNFYFDYQSRKFLKKV